jgi:hypothetical protein
VPDSGSRCGEEASNPSRRFIAPSRYAQIYLMGHQSPTGGVNGSRPWRRLCLRAKHSIRLGHHGSAMSSDVSYGSTARGDRWGSVAMRGLIAARAGTPCDCIILLAHRGGGHTLNSRGSPAYLTSKTVHIFHLRRDHTYQAGWTSRSLRDADLNAPRPIYQDFYLA